MSDLLPLVSARTLPAPVTASLFIYLFVLNIAAFALFGLDKHKARTGGRRIPEAVFFMLASAGAVPGLWFAMGAFHHKTRKAGFRYGLPLIALLQVLVVIYLLST